MINDNLDGFSVADLMYGYKKPNDTIIEQKEKPTISSKAVLAFAKESNREDCLINPEELGEPWGNLLVQFRKRRDVTSDIIRWKIMMKQVYDLGENPTEFSTMVHTQAQNPKVEKAQEINKHQFVPNREMKNEPDIKPDIKPVLHGLHSITDAFEPLPPINWIVENIAAPGTVGVFFGQPGSMKTFALLDMAVCVSIGKDWCGNKTRKAKILIVDEESGERRMAERLRMASRGQLAQDKIEEMAACFKYTCLQRFDLQKPESINQLETYVRETGAELVIMDALADFTPGADENTTKDMLPTMNALRTIAERHQCAIMLIHHANKQGSYRGSSAILGAVDLMVNVSFDRDVLLLTFESTKTRDTDALKWAAKAHFSDGEFWLEQYQPEPGEPSFGKVDRYIVNCITEGHNSRKWMMEHAAENSLSDGSVKNGIARLASKGVICRANPSGNPRVEAIYNLSTGNGNNQ